MYIFCLHFASQLKVLNMLKTFSKWMDDLRFYLLVNSISVISEEWVDNNEMLCAMEPLLQLKRSLHQVGFGPELLDQQASI